MFRIHAPTLLVNKTRSGGFKTSSTLYFNPIAQSLCVQIKIKCLHCLSVAFKWERYTISNVQNHQNLNNTEPNLWMYATSDGYLPNINLWRAIFRNSETEANQIHIPYRYLQAMRFVFKLIQHINNFL